MTDPDDHTDTPPNMKQKLRDFFLDASNFVEIERAGTFVFVGASIFTVVFASVLGITHLCSGDSANSDLHPYIHAIERMFGLLAIGITVAFVARGKHWMVFFSGIVIIGAILLPVSDLARYMLIWSGREQNYELLFGPFRSAGDVSGRSSDLASEIAHRLEESSTLDFEGISVTKVSEIIQKEIEEFEIITLAEQVRARGAYATLERLNASSSKATTILKHGREDQFINDLRFLRSRGLIQYLYDDITSLQVTNLGKRVLDPEFDIDADRAAEPSVSPEASINCPADLLSVEDISTSISQDVKLVLKDEPRFLKFSAQSAGDYTIKVSADSNSPADPFLRLYRITPENECHLLSEDDDTDGLNPKLVASLASGEQYLLSMWSLYFNGDVLVSVRKNSDSNSSQ